MAGAGDPVQDLCEEITCPICLDYFSQPVTIPACGHNFCRGCLDNSRGEASCPQCRGTFQPGSLWPNRQLANVVEIARKLRSQAPGGAEGACEKHREPLKLFCRDHEAAVCVVCDRSKEHRGHQVVPLEEVAEEYKNLVCIQLEVLRRKKQKILVDKAEAEKESRHLLELTETERQKTMAQFQEIRQFLEEQEKLLLSEMNEVEKEIARQRDEHRAKLSIELASTENVIRELEKKRQQSASELMKDVQSTLKRSEKKAAVFENPAAFSPELKWRIWDFCDINPFLEGVLEQFRKAFLHGQQLEKVNVTLDPDTAHPRLILSEDKKGVRCGVKPQDVPKNPERFEVRICVLGREEFKAGRYFWEVLVEGEGIWAVGVVTKSVMRKMPVEFGPEEGVWAVGKWNDEYRSIQPPENPFLLLKRQPTRIRVTLNYAGERVAFFDADTGDFLYAFPAASFSGETILPYFYVVRKAHLRISS